MEDWDEVFIKTEFMKSVISKLLHKALEKAGYDTEVQLNELIITNKEEKVYVHLNAEMEMGAKEMEEILNKILQSKRLKG